MALTNQDVLARVTEVMSEQSVSQRSLSITMGWSLTSLRRRLTNRVPFTMAEVAEVATGLGVEWYELLDSGGKVNGHQIEDADITELGDIPVEHVARVLAAIS